MIRQYFQQPQSVLSAVDACLDWLNWVGETTAIKICRIKTNRVHQLGNVKREMQKSSKNFKHNCMTFIFIFL